MKILILPLFALAAYTSNAQFSVAPEVGVETVNTTIQSGNFSSFSPLGQQFAPRMAVRMAYALKTGHGLFAGVATSSPAVELKFADPEKLNSVYTTTTQNLQLRFEGGYQFTSKPISLKGANKNINAGTGVQNSRVGSQSRCGRSLCSRNKSSASRYGYSPVATASEHKGMVMRVKPSLGIAFVPAGSELTTEATGAQTTYVYKTGLNTALIAGTAFEFGTREQAKFIISMNYVTSVGNNTQTISNNDAFKPTATSLSSKTSGFNISLGVPLTFKKKTTTPVIATPPTPQINRPARYGHCSRYKSYEL